MNLFLKKLWAKRKVPLIQNINHIIFFTRKRIFHLRKSGFPEKQKIVFIIGCQRSGTGDVVQDL